MLAWVECRDAGWMDANATARSRSQETVPPGQTVGVLAMISERSPDSNPVNDRTTRRLFFLLKNNFRKFVFFLKKCYNVILATFTYV